VLLEREAFLEVLAGPPARLILIGGEAGVGKTALVREFAAGRRVLWGACDPLLTPRPLGPLLDVAEAAGGELLAAAEAGARPAALVAALLRELRASPGTVLVLEDVHWADDATLDVLRYLGRRVAELPVVLVVTYRDEEVGPALQRVLGALGGSAVHRLAPARLSRAAVARLVGGTAATSAPL